MATVSFSGLFNSSYAPISGQGAYYSPVNSKALALSEVGGGVRIDKGASDFETISKQFRHGSKDHLKWKNTLAAALGGSAGASINSGSAVNQYGVKHPSVTPTQVGAFAGNERQGTGAVETREALAASSTVTAADITNFKAALAKTFAIAPASMPVDLSGNGGGGRLTAKYSVK